MVRSPPRRLDTRTREPSGVNFSRFAPGTFAAMVSVTVLETKLIIEMVPSCALATQISWPLGETSKPSEPLPIFTTVCSQSPPGGVGRGGGLLAPAGAPGMRGGILSMMLTLPEVTFVVTIRFSSSVSQIM